MRIFFMGLFLIILTLFGLAAWLVYTPAGAEWAVQKAVARSLGPGAVAWEKINGSLIRGVEAVNLEVHGIPYLPPGSFLRVQSLTVRLTEFSVNGFDVHIVNARFFLENDDAVVFNLRLLGRQLSGNVYAHGFSLGSVREILMQFFEVPYFKGSVRDIDLEVRGTPDQPSVRGTFYVESIIRDEMTLAEVPVRVDLSFLKGNTRWETRGKLFLDGGWLRNAFVKMDLKPSRLTFTGRPAMPELDIHAVAKVKRTQIVINIQGTRQSPKVALSSDPVYPKEQILLILATGRPWPGLVENASGDARLTPALTSNVVDYLFFGGQRSKIIKALGLSDISFQADEKSRGVTISKDLTGRFGLGYGVGIGTGTQSQRQVTQRLQGEYYFTDKFLLGAQKELKPDRVSGALGSSNDPSAGGSLSADEPPDDRIFLKYRSAF